MEVNPVDVFLILGAACVLGTMLGVSASLSEEARGGFWVGVVFTVLALLLGYSIAVFYM